MENHISVAKTQSPALDSINLLANNKIERNNNQNLMSFILRKAISGAPSLLYKT